jgi:hypothetical protein
MPALGLKREMFPSGLMHLRAMPDGEIAARQPY